MELDEDRYNLVCEQLKQCLLPALDRDIGNEQLVKEDFGMFRYGLEMNLQLLFDIVARKERILFEPFDGDNTFRVYFTLLLHQQSGYDEAPFQTDNESISKQFRFLTEKYYKKLISQPAIRSECLKYYKERLTADKWKRNIGAVYGYLQMNKLHQKLIQTKFNSDDCLFMLSVGMLLVDYFETLYKKFGLIIFITLMEYGHVDELQKINVYEVIFKKMMKPLISILTDEESTVLVYRCVYKCVECIGNWNDPAKWNEVDDVLEDIITRIPIESDNRCVAIIFLFILKLITLPMKRQKNFKKLVDFEHLENVIKASKMSNEKRRQLFNELRNTFKNHHNLLIARWSKRLIEIYQYRDIFGKPEDIRFQIYVMHIAYICCFYGNPLFMAMNWQSFLHEFIAQLMRFIANNINREVFIDEISVFLDTIQLHLETAERTPTFFLPEHEEYVSNMIKAIDDIRPVIKEHCKRKVHEELEDVKERKERLLQKTMTERDDSQSNEEEEAHSKQEVEEMCRKVEELMVKK